MSMNLKFTKRKIYNEKTIYLIDFLKTYIINVNRIQEYFWCQSGGDNHECTFFAYLDISTHSVIYNIEYGEMFL